MKNPGLPRRLAPLALALWAVLLASCGSGSGSGGNGSATLRVIDAAYQAATNFDAISGGTTIATDLSFGQASAFQALGSSTASVQIDPTGTTTVSTTASFAAAGGTPYSVVIVGGTSGASTVTVAQASGSVAAGQSRLGFVNADPAQAALDIYVTGPADALPATPSLGALAYAGAGQSATASSVVLNSGDYRIRAVATGDTSLAVVFDSGPVTFTSMADLLLAVVPAGGSASAFALLAAPASGAAFAIADQRVPVRFGNFAPALGTVDSFVVPVGSAPASTTLFASGIAPDTVTPYQNELPGTYRASLAFAGTTTEVLGTSLPLVAGSPVSVFATGVAQQGVTTGLQLLVLNDDLNPPASGQAGLRVVELAPDFGAADVVLLDVSGTTPVITRRLAVNLAYASASAYVGLPAGTYVMALVPTGADTPIAPAAGSSLTLAAGSVYTLVATGCRTPGAGACFYSTQGLALDLLLDH